MRFSLSREVRAIFSFWLIFFASLFFTTQNVEGTQGGTLKVEDVCYHLRTKRPQCFDTMHKSDRTMVPEVIADILGMKNTIKMEVVWWETQAMLTFALDILFREKLGYEVDLIDITPWKTKTTGTNEVVVNCVSNWNDWNDNVLNMKSQREAGIFTPNTVNLQYANVWRGIKTFEIEHWTFSGREGRNIVRNDFIIDGNPEKVKFDGPLGPTARNGWFINHAALKGKDYDTIALIQANGGFDISSPVHLMQSSELPVMTDPGSWRDTHCSGKERNENFQGGVLDCIHWTWESPTATCCTRRMRSEGTCATDLEDCFAVVVENPGWLSQLEKNELRVMSSGAPFEIVYAGAGKTKEVVQAAIDADKPTIFYWWEPDLYIEPNKFLRVNMLAEMYCANELFDSSASRSSNSIPRSSNHTGAPCDFGTDKLEKTSYKPDRLYFPDAFSLFENFEVNFQESWDLVNQTNNESLIAMRDSIWQDWDGVGEDAYYNQSLLYNLGACEWLKQNEHVWKDYIDPETYIYDDIQILAIALAAFAVYVFGQFLLIYRRGAYYDVEVTKSLEVVEASNSESFSAGRLNVLDAIDMEIKPVKEELSDNVSFIVKHISCGSDEKCVEFSITSTRKIDDVYLVCKPGPHRSDVPDTWGTVPYAKLGKDFALPFFVNEAQKGTQQSIDENTLHLSLPAGTTKLRLPLLNKNKQYSPARVLHLVLEPGSIGRESSSSFSSALPVLEICIYPHLPFMYGSKSTGLSTEGKGSFWAHRSLYVLIKNCLSVDYISNMQWQYQLKQLVCALLETFWWNFLFMQLIDEGYINKRGDMCIWAALWWMFIEIFIFHTGLHYFNGAYLIKTHFELLLLYKYTLLSSGDLSQIKDSEPYFRVTLFTDCEAIREEFWKPLNESMEGLFRMVGASLFLGITYSDRVSILFMKLMYALPYSFLAASILFGFFRSARGLKIGLDEDKLEVLVYSGAHVTLHNSFLVRELKSMVDFCSLQYDRLWYHLNGGVFERWYHEYYNMWTMRFLAAVVTSAFYALPNKFLADFEGHKGKVTVGEYVVSLCVMLQLLTSCVLIFKNGSAVLEVLSKVEHISELLNFKTSEELRIENKPLDESGMRNHEGTEVVQETKSKGDDYLFEFDDVTLDYPPRNVFKKCSMEDRSSRRVTRISQGGIVGILRSSDGSAKAFFNVLCREDVPLHGKCGFAPKLYFARVNSDTGALLEAATLRSNLLITAENRLKSLARHSPASFAFLEQLRGYTSRVVWDVCKSVGLSVTVIGERHNPDWSNRCLDEDLKLVDGVDLIKLRLVRALLALPDVLVMDEFGDDMTTEDLNAVVKVLRQYLEFKLPGIDETSASALLKAKSGIRTILWSGHERTLRPHLDSKNRVLSLQSVSKIAVDGAVDGAW